MSKRVPEPKTIEGAIISSVVNDGRLKKIVTITFLFVFIGLLIFLICVIIFMPDRKDLEIIIGSIEAILAISIRPLAKHFYSGKTSAEKLIARMDKK